MSSGANLWARFARSWTYSSIVLLTLGAMQTTFTDAQEVMRIAAWNTANKPNCPQDADAFRTILGAIGEEDVHGISKRLDILALSETDTASSQALVGLMNDLYGVDSYQVVTSSSDRGGDRTGFVYDTSTVALLDSVDLTRGLTHSILSAQFQPIRLPTDEAFTAYAVHLKSGDSGSPIFCHVARPSPVPSGEFCSRIQDVSCRDGDTHQSWQAGTSCSALSGFFLGSFDI